ncbi:MAG: CRTAC1 family protein, partial [Planctomycetes bacterium]|nr:CRTAC1 family protein [Planctomycetota bacterium]
MDDTRSLTVSWVRPGRMGLTAVLAVLACVVVVAVVWRVISHEQQADQIAESKEGQGPTSGNPKSEIRNPKSESAPIFSDVTEQANIHFRHVTGGKGSYWIPEEMGPGGAFFDYDGDGDLDLYLVQSGEIGTDNASHRNVLLRNDGAGRFEDVSEGSGADIPGYGMGCAAADYDNDGDVDLYVTRLGPDALLRNNGDGTFTDVTASAGIDNPGFGTCVAFFDYDRDGRLDIFISNYMDWAEHREQACYDAGGVRDFCNPKDYKAPAIDKLYHNVGDGRFEDVSVASGIAAVKGHSLGVLCSDFDGDGWLDIFVASDQTPGLLWINQKDGTFVEDGALRGCAFSSNGLAIAGMGVAAEDFDGDGDYDIIVTNIHDQPHLVLRNDGGYFEDVTHAWGLGGWGVPLTAFGIAVFDQNHDGLFDMFVGNGAVNRLNEPYFEGQPYAEPNQFVRLNAEGRFIDASTEIEEIGRIGGMSRSTIQGDYDNDGDVDVLVTNNGGAARLLRNENPAGGAWAMLDLIPQGGGRHALNARIELQAGGRTFHRELRPHVGYLGSNDPRIHVGL